MKHEVIGSEIMAGGDINADRQTEFVFCQGPGMLSAAVFQPGAPGWYDKHTTREDQELNCLTAIDLQGSILWQRGQPWTNSFSFRTHGGESMMVAADGDGKMEQVLAVENLGLVVSDLEGNILWMHAVPTHCGEACVGKFLAEVPGLQIMITNERFSIPYDPSIMGTEILDA